MDGWIVGWMASHAITNAMAMAMAWRGIGMTDAEPAAAAAGGDHGDDPRGVPVSRRRDRRGGHEEGSAVSQQGLREQARHSRG